jgi:hypothetical protein
MNVLKRTATRLGSWNYKVTVDPFWGFDTELQVTIPKKPAPRGVHLSVSPFESITLAAHPESE